MKIYPSLSKFNMRCHIFTTSHYLYHFFKRETGSFNSSTTSIILSSPEFPPLSFPVPWPFPYRHLNHNIPHHGNRRVAAPTSILHKSQVLICPPVLSTHIGGRFGVLSSKTIPDSCMVGRIVAALISCDLALTHASCG